jgi:hypothetical protein
MTTPPSPRSPARDPITFNRQVLGGAVPDGLGNRGFWARQKDLCRALVESPVVLVETGNAVGKSYADARLILWYLVTHPDSLVVATAPSETVLSSVVWGEVERAYDGARVPLGGRMLRNPLKLTLGGPWQAIAFSTRTVERFSSFHRRDLLAVVDEASGVAPEIIEAIDALNPSRLLMTGNPLRPDGPFYERCAAARDGRSPHARALHISSLESRHIHLGRSPWGLADASWLAKVRNDYGENSLFWQTHVLGRAPGAAQDALIPPAWLDRAAGVAEHIWSGPKRLAIDLGGGAAGDFTALVVRDDNGVIALEASSHWGFETAATRAALLAQRHGVEPPRIVFDVSAIGHDFANRLEGVSLRGCQPYRGGAVGGVKFGNLRSAASWQLRQRLDPNRLVPAAGGVPRPQPPFRVPPPFLAAGLREELQGLKYDEDRTGRVCLEPKEEFARRLKRSPDRADALIMSFAFPD